MGSGNVAIVGALLEMPVYNLLTCRWLLLILLKSYMWVDAYKKKTIYELFHSFQIKAKFGL